MSGAMCLLPLYPYDLHMDNLPFYCQPNSFLPFIRIGLQNYSQSEFSIASTPELFRVCTANSLLPLTYGKSHFFTFPLYETSRSVVGPTKPPVNGYSCCFPGTEFDPSPPPGVEVKNLCSFASIPPYAILA